MLDLLGRSLEEGQKVVVPKDVLPRHLVGTIAKVGAIPTPHPQIPQGVVDIVVVVEIHLAVAAGTPMLPDLVICDQTTAKPGRVIVGEAN